METFGHMAAAFNDWKLTNNIPLNFNDSRGYFWRIGNPAKEHWQPEFQTQVPDAKPEEIESFRKMFEENSELLGIPVAKNLSDYKGISLYKMNEYDKSYNITNMLTAYNGTILNSDISDKVDDTVNSETINIPILIKPGSIKFTGAFDGIDVVASKVNGLIYGEGFKNGKRNVNRISGESIMGNIDYRTGDIQLIRSNSINDELLPEYAKFIEEYNNLPAGTVIGGTADSTGTVPVSIAPAAPTGKIVYISFDLSYKIFGNPATKIWEFML